MSDAFPVKLIHEDWNFIILTDKWFPVESAHIGDASREPQHVIAENWDAVNTTIQRFLVK